MTTPTEVVLVRWGEIFLKGQNRGWFERTLVDNAKRAVAGIAGARIERTHGRLIAWSGEGGAKRLVRALERVFGISSVSAALVVPRELEAITQAAIELGRREAGDRKPTFKIETRRADKRWQPPSPEVSRIVGGAVYEALGLPVDVHNPQLTIGIEIGLEHAFIYAEPAAPGPGGLPVGVSGRVELLLSGGIDSPVAGWMLMKRGCKIGATYFHSFPYTGEKTQDKVQRLAQILAAWQLSDVRLAVVPFTDAQKKLRDASIDGRLAVVLYRRMMIRVAERIAKKSGAKALATGEALAQVASQTLDNMAAIEDAATIPILRPCLAHDKQETITIARRIGTFETSIEPYDDCCSLFVPDHPETRARIVDVQAMEAQLDLNAIVESCVAGVTEIICRP